MGKSVNSEHTEPGGSSAVSKNSGLNGCIGPIVGKGVSSVGGKEEVHGLSGSWPKKCSSKLDVSLSKLPGLCLMETEESSVDGGEFGPLVIGAISIEGVIVFSLDGLWVSRFIHFFTFLLT